MTDLRPADRYTLPAALRGELAQAYGPVLSTRDLADALVNYEVVAAVGDVVSMTLHRLGIEPRLFICDYKTQRGDDDPEFVEVLGAWGDREIRVPNPAAQITREAWDAVRQGLAATGTTRILVDGEEDLLGIPCFLEAPDHAAVLYGMPGQGVVLVHVDDALRRRVAGLVARLEQPGTASPGPGSAPSGADGDTDANSGTGAGTGTATRNA